MASSSSSMDVQQVAAWLLFLAKRKDRSAAEVESSVMIALHNSEALMRGPTARKLIALIQETEEPHLDYANEEGDEAEASPWAIKKGTASADDDSDASPQVEEPEGDEKSLGPFLDATFCRGRPLDISSNLVRYRLIRAAYRCVDNPLVERLPLPAAVCTVLEAVRMQMQLDLMELRSPTRRRPQTVAHILRSRTACPGGGRVRTAPLKAKTGPAAPALDDATQASSPSLHDASLLGSPSASRASRGSVRSRASTARRSIFSSTEGTSSISLLDDFCADAFFANVLTEAAAHGDLDTVRIMTDFYPEHMNRMHTRLRYTCLHAAADFGMNDVIEFLVKEAGADVNQPCVRMGRNPLGYAAESTRWETCALLISLGSSRSMSDRYGQNAAQIALDNVQKIEVDKVYLLRESPARIEKVYHDEVGPHDVYFRVDPPPESPSRAHVTAYACRGVEKVVRHATEAFVQRARELSDMFILESYEPDAINDVHGPIDVISPNADRILVPGLFPATAYAFQICAMSDAGESLPSDTQHLVTAAYPPSAPSKPYSIATTSTSISVAWVASKFDNGEPIEGYEVQRKLIEAEELEQMSFSELSSIATGSSLHTISTAASQRSASLSPAAKARAGRWAKYRVGGGTFTYTCGSFPLYGVARFRIRAFNKVGYSHTSLEVILVADDPIRLNDKSARHLAFEWTRPVQLDVVAYEINYREAAITRSDTTYRVAEDDFRPHADVDGIAESVDASLDQSMDSEEKRQKALDEKLNKDAVKYTLSGLDPGMKYQIRVRAMDRKTGWQPWSDAMVSSVFETVKDKPSAPGLPSSDLSLCSGESIFLTWAASKPNGAIVDLYDIWASTDFGPWEQMSSCIHNTADVPHLNSGSQYRFRVRARNDVGWSEFGEESEVVTTNSIAPPGRPEIVAMGGSWVQLKWVQPASVNVVDVFEVYMLVTGTEEYWDYAPAMAVPAAMVDANAAAEGGDSSHAEGAEGGQYQYQWQAVARVEGTSCTVPDLKSSFRYKFKIRCATAFGWSPFGADSDVIKLPRRH
uniref:Fibronectin type-III domain-containing protein n=1 Tax=Phaeomonas parva TaxID=124430 RepID=A0A7S1XYK0_9STRA|mmetsp:Transcript_9210/g.26913  ORF Transcript_9210/g.26913 Transcript_9210/m.26913 type:complete len:1039 (+) Transcript_9210:162-3278(+)